MNLYLFTLSCLLVYFISENNITFKKLPVNTQLAIAIFYFMNLANIFFQLLNFILSK